MPLTTLLDTIRSRVQNTTDEDRDTDETDADGTPPDTDTSSIDPGQAHAVSVSPSSIKIESDTVRAQNRWCKVLFISDWPDAARPGMLDMVTTHPSSEVDVSIHATPREQAAAIDQFKAAIHDLQVQLQGEQQRGDPSQNATKKRIEDHQQILAQLEDRTQTVADVSVYITIRTATKGRTEKVARQIANELEKYQLHATSVDYRQGDGLSSASPIAKDVLAHDVPDVSTPMLGRAVGALFPFSATTIIEEDGVIYGQHATTDSPVIIDRYARENGYNLFTAGMIGAGKSYGTKLLNLRLLAKDPDTILVMLDPMSGFRDLAEGLGGEMVTLDGTRGLNPLEIRPTPQHILDANPDLDPFRQAFDGAMGFFEEFFRAVDSGGQPLTKTERAVLSEALRTAYSRSGITEDPSTHHHDSPTIIGGEGTERVMSVLAEIETDTEAFITAIETDDSLVNYPDPPEPSEGYIEKWRDAAENLRMAMHPFRTAEYAHLSGETEIDLHEAKVTYLDLQQGESEREMGLMMQLLLDAVYQRAKTSPKKVVLCIDEAHYLMQNEASLDWLERLTRHSRHYDLSLHLVTQEASDFLIHDKAETIANNCSQKILHRLPGLEDDDAAALGLTEREAEFVRQAQPGSAERGYSHALVSVDDDATLPVKVWAYDREEAIIEGDTASEESTDGGHAATGRAD